MPVAGLEPARGCPQQILSLPRLPFRHTGISTTELYLTISPGYWQVFFLTFQLGIQVKTVEGCEVILRRLSASDQLYTSILL